MVTHTNILPLLFLFIFCACVHFDCDNDPVKQCEGNLAEGRHTNINCNDN